MPNDLSWLLSFTFARNFALVLCGMALVSFACAWLLERMESWDASPTLADEPRRAADTAPSLSSAGAATYRSYAGLDFGPGALARPEVRAYVHPN